MAPELHGGMLSTKADVYSFGMVILEIISGKKKTSASSSWIVSLVSSSAPRPSLRHPSLTHRIIKYLLVQSFRYFNT